MKRETEESQSDRTRTKECLLRQLSTDDLSKIRYSRGERNPKIDCLLPKQDVEGSNPFTRSKTDINHSYFASRHLDYMCLPGEVAQITGTISAKYTRRQCTTNHMDEYRLLQKESL